MTSKINIILKNSILNYGHNLHKRCKGWKGSLSEKELILFDVKTMDGNNRTISYINSDDKETLNYLENLYSLVAQ